MPLIAADNDLAVLAALFAIAACGFAAEKTRLGAQITGAVVTILLAIGCANLGLLPHAAPVYDVVFRYFVPILIPLFLLQADLRRLLFETTRTTLAFALACVGTVAGVLSAIALLDLGSLGAAALEPALREPALAGLFASTYIGGSVNYAALGEITGLREDASLFSAATAADNLFSAVYLALLALLPGWSWLARRFPTHRQAAVPPAASGVSAASDASPAGAPSRPSPGPATAMSLTVSLALSLLIVVLGDALTASLSAPTWRYAIISALALLPATLMPRLMARLSGGFELGIGLSFVFFAAIAAGADVAAMIKIAPLLIALVAILLLVHALVVFGGGALLGLSLPELITASNAAILGATTAPALAAAKGWRELVTPGVLVGVFGYAAGTVIGTALFSWLSPG